MIQSGQASRNRALKIIYKGNRNLVCSYILKNNGSLEEAKDIYQETIVAFYENVQANKFKGDSAIATYIYSIAKFKWLNQIKKNSIRTRHHEKIEVEVFYESPLATIIDKEKSIGVLEVLSQLGEGCKKLLIESIYHAASMKEIVESSDYSSEQIVRNKKYKCLQKLKELINERPALVKILKRYE